MGIPSTNWYTKLYSQFRGVDFSTDATNIADERAADALNLVADEAGFPSKRVGWRELVNFSSAENNGYSVNGLHYMKFQRGAGMWFIHVGTKLYAIPHLSRMRNVLPDGKHMDEEYNRNFMPTQSHVDWLEGYVAGTSTATYDWQVRNADNNQDGVVDETDVQLLQAIVDCGIAPEMEGTSITLVSSNLRNQQSVSFEVGGNLYLLDGEHYFVIKREETDGGYYGNYSLEEVTGYIPTVGSNGYYFYDDKNDEDPGTWMHCQPFEEQNHLSTSVICTMAGDGNHKEYWTITKAAAVTKVELLGNDGETWTETSAYATEDDGTHTKVTFTEAPAQHPDGAGFDNIRVTYTPVHQLDPDVIKKCTIATKYGYFNDNRVFVTGNPDKPNYDYMSGVDDPTYFPEFGWTQIGASYSAIQGYLHYGDILAIVKEDTNADPEVYIRSYEVLEDQSIIFPVQQGIKGVGAASRNAFASLRDDALFFAKEGVYAIAGTDASQQRTLQNRSFFVDVRLRQESGKPVACVWRDKYILCFPDTGHVYVADGKQQTNYESAAYFYEWYFWDGIFANHFYEIDGDLYFTTRTGSFCKFNTDITDLTRFSDGMTRTEDGTFSGGVAIPARWTTKADFLAGISETKSLARRGCSIMLKPYERSSVRAVVETEGLIVNQTVDVVGDEITSTVFPFERNIKRFSTIQMTFSNDEKDEGFGLYGIQLRYAVSRLVR